MSDDKYNISWNTFADHLKQLMKGLLDSKTSFDVTLVGEDKVKLKAHRFVLRACSPVLDNILSDQEDEGREKIYLRDINSEELRSILQFMYTGEATFHEERMNKFLEAARILEVKQLNDDREMDSNTYTDYTEGIDVGQNCSPEIHDMKQNEDTIIDRTVTVGSDSGVSANSKHGVQCPECGKEFSKRSNMKNHFNSIHENLRRFSCDFCNLRFTQKAHLQTHQKRIHN